VSSKANNDSSLLPILTMPAQPAHGFTRGRRRWRALTLLAVHVVILAHVAHYLAMGRTLSPVEPSEAMATIELGRVNAGAIFFALAIASTMVFGRFFCGWGCHLLAVQDLCSFILTKLHIRPATFRSRVLAIVPFAAAFYMFLWPTMSRMWHGVPRHAWTNHLVTDRYWASFPGPVYAVLTIAVCGAGAVYLLGSKGFCTYVCPYGAIFSIADRMALGRIRVTDACNGCGQCTIACTSNVRVHEEVRDFGMVLDPNCMKCTDCVSVCPNDALYYGLRAASDRPFDTVDRSRRRIYDVTLSEDIVALAATLFSVFALRGLYDGPPLLLSITLGVMTGYLAVAVGRIPQRKEVLLGSFQIRRACRLTRVGLFAVLVIALWFAFVAHSFLVQWHRHRGMTKLSQLTVSWEESVSPDWRFATLSNRDQTLIRSAQINLEKADRLGLLDVTDVKLGLAWIALLHGERSAAKTYVRQAIALSPKHEQLQEMLLDISLTKGALPESNRDSSKGGRNLSR
jgi:ferredoxin